MLQVRGRPFLTPTRKVFQEDVGDTVCENHTRLGELATGNVGLPFGHNGRLRLQVPGPTQVGPAAHPTTESEQTVPEEDASLDEVGESVEDFMASL